MGAPDQQGGIVLKDRSALGERDSELIDSVEELSWHLLSEWFAAHEISRSDDSDSM